MKKVNLTVLLITIGFLSLSAQTPTKVANNSAPTDKEHVHAAVMNYVMGLYEVDTARIEKSVHPTLFKRGYYQPDGQDDYKGPVNMTYEQLVSLAARWNKSGKQANADSPKEIVIFDVQDKTASAKLTAEWGTDYFHLAKENGKWYIMNVLWQSK